MSSFDEVAKMIPNKLTIDELILFAMRKPRHSCRV